MTKKMLEDKYPQCVINDDVKIVDKFWTDLVVRDRNGNTPLLAIEFVYKYKTPKYAAKMMEKYDNAKINYFIIVIENECNTDIEYNLNCVKREQLHSKNGILLLLNENLQDVIMVKSENNILYKRMDKFCNVDFLDEEYFSNGFAKSEEIKCKTKNNDVFVERKNADVINEEESANFYLSEEQIEQLLNDCFYGDLQKRKLAWDKLNKYPKHNDDTKKNFISVYKKKSVEEQKKINYQFNVEKYINSQGETL